MPAGHDAHRARLDAPVRTVALVDSYWGGHHATYIRLYTRTLLELGFRVAVLCPQPVLVQNWIRDHDAALLDRLTVAHLSEPRQCTMSSPRIRNAINAGLYWFHAVRALRRLKRETGWSIDLVFFMWLDSYITNKLSLVLLDLLFPFRWAGLLFHPRGLRPTPSWKSKLLPAYRILRSRNCQFVAVLVKSSVSLLSAQIPDKPVLAFPDVTDDVAPTPGHPTAVRLRQLAGRRTTVGLLGLEKRKGVLTLLDASERAGEEAYFFVFSGVFPLASLAPSEIARIQEAAARASHTRFFDLRSSRIEDEADYNAILDSFDIIFAAYHGFIGSSNMLTKAAVLKRPVIASAGCLMGDRVEEYGMGATVPEGDPDSVLAAIRSLSMGCRLDGRRLRPRFEAYLADHGQARLAAKFRLLLRQDGRHFVKDSGQQRPSRRGPIAEPEQADGFLI